MSEIRLYAAGRYPRSFRTSSASFSKNDSLMSSSFARPLTRALLGGAWPLKRQYEFALRVWGEYEFPIHNQPVGTQVWRSEELRLQLKQKALDARDAANERVLDHKLTCPLCAAKP
jgi:hypothetical protein